MRSTARRVGYASQATLSAPGAAPERGKPLQGAVGVSGAVDASTGVQTLVLDGFPSVAQVKLLGPNSGTANRYAVNRARQSVQARVKIEAGMQGLVPVEPPVRVTLRYVFSDARHRDSDNFAAIAKPCVDGLVKAEILKGDNHARLTERVEFVKEPGARRLEVVIEREV